MQEFEQLVVLFVAAVILAAAARRVGAPYPVFLAIGGALLAFLPGGPSLTFPPELALALFVAPVLLDAAYDASLRDLRDNWGPVTGLVIFAVGFTTAAALVHELIEARDEKRLLRLQRQVAACTLLIIDELGYVPLSPTGAELLFEVFSQRYERGSVIVTSNLPFDEWTSVFGSERLTGALLDRLTHHVHILEMNGESYRLRQSKHRRRSPRSDPSPSQPA